MYWTLPEDIMGMYTYWCHWPTLFWTTLLV